MNIDRNQIASTISKAIGMASTRTVRGNVASYIPELAKADPKKAGIAVTLANGETFGAGDYNEQSTIQSVSKVFTLAMALGTVGDRLWNRVGREPSGSSFDSILQLEHEQGIPRNPFVNAGAIVVTDEILANYQPKRRWAKLCALCKALQKMTRSISIRRWHNQKHKQGIAIAHWPTICCLSIICVTSQISHWAFTITNARYPCLALNFHAPDDFWHLAAAWALTARRSWLKNAQNVSRRSCLLAATMMGLAISPIASAYRLKAA